jgi:phage shock protein A
MILSKIWHSIQAQLNKLANFFSGYDPVAEMQLEYDKSVAQIKEGREGLAQYRALVERVLRQVENQKKQVAVLEAKIKAYLQANDRDSAAQAALELQRAKGDLAENEKQLDMHEQAYQNNLLKIKRAIQKLDEIKHRITKYDAELKMSRAEAEMAELANQFNFNFNVTTDFGKAEEILQDQIDKNRARVRVVADMSGEGVEDIKREMAVERTMGESALRQFELEQGLVTPETAGASKASTKELGPAKTLEPIPEV